MKKKINQVPQKEIKMGKKHLLHYSLNRAVVDYDSIEEEETKECFEKFKILFETTGIKPIEKVKALPPMTFEFNAENMDSDYSDWLEEPFVSIDLSPASDLTSPGAIYEDGLIKIQNHIVFEVELKNGVKPEKFQEWIEDNGGWQACSIIGDWSYSEDEGGDLYVLGIKRKRR
jgi:hypothetical protein